MKKLILLISLLIPSIAKADSITPGSVGLLLPVTGQAYDPADTSKRSWGDKYNGNFTIIASSLNSVISNQNRSAVIVGENSGTRVGDISVLNLTGSGISGFTCSGTTCTATITGSGGGGGASSLAVGTGSAQAVNIISSPTAVINFSSGPFTVRLTGGGTAYIGIDYSSITAQGKITGGSGGEDAFGNPISTRPITALYGITASSVVVVDISSAAVFYSTGGFTGGGSTFTSITLSDSPNSASPRIVMGGPGVSAMSIYTNGNRLLDFNNLNLTMINGPILGKGGSGSAPDFSFSVNQGMGMFADKLSPPARLGLTSGIKPMLIIDANGMIGTGGKYGRAGFEASTGQVPNAPILWVSSGRTPSFEVTFASTSVNNSFFAVTASTFMDVIFTTADVQVGGVKFTNYMSTVDAKIATLGGGGGGLSSLAVGKGSIQDFTQISSPTTHINFATGPFIVSLISPTTAFVTIDYSSFTMQGKVIAGGGSTESWGYISTRVVQAGFGINASSVTVESSMTVRDVIISTTGALLGGATIQGRLNVEGGTITLNNIKYIWGSVAPSDGQIPKYNNTNGLVEWKADNTGAGGGSSFNNGRVQAFLNEGGMLLSASTHAWTQMDYDGSITSFTVTSDQAGEIRVNVKKTSYDNFPNNFTSVCSAACPSLSGSTVKNSDISLTGWTKTFNQGDFYQVNIDTVPTGATKVNVTLWTSR